MLALDSHKDKLAISNDIDIGIREVITFPSLSTSVGVSPTFHVLPRTGAVAKCHFINYLIF